MSMLELRQVSKVYGQGAAEVHALREVDLDVGPGTMVAVMGPSGSGKSTLLTIAGSLEDPTSGQVLVAGQDLETMSRNDKARLRRRSIGYVFQDFNLLPGLTAAENVALPLELDGTRARKARKPGCACSQSWAWRTARRATLTSCPAASASGSRSPVRLSATGTCCSPTSRPARWTRRMAMR